RGVGPEQRHSRGIGFDDQLRRRRESVRDQHAWQVVDEHAPEDGRAVRRRQTLEEPYFAATKYQDPPAAQIRVEARKREARLLNVRDGNAAVDAIGAGEELDVELTRVGGGGE